MTPIYVPSRGRSSRSATLSALMNESYPEVIICTPGDEMQTYRDKHDVPGWRVIPQSGKGIGSARQSILTHARNRGLERFWMIDDDTTGVYQREGGTRFRRLDTFAEAIAQMEAAVGINRDYVTMFGPQFRHRAWHGAAAEMDVHLRNFVCVRTDIHGDYWPHVKEDLDMVLQALTAGEHTARFNFIAFDSPRMGTTEGGCFDDYQTGVLEDASKRLVERWPGLVKLVLDEQTGFVNNRVNWKAVRLRTVKDVPRTA